MGRSFRAQMKYAGKTGIPFLLVLGDDEISSGKAKLKAMADGTEKEVALTDLADAIRGWTNGMEFAMLALFLVIFTDQMRGFCRRGK